MIDKETIETIFTTARIDEVVGDFVSLKKRGVNYLGNCPFHNEKTPSFTVSPAKGIYKCFGCGVGGNSVNFIMEHEHYTYPEALKYLARKYNIEIHEEELTPEMEKQQSEKESLFIVSGFAEEFFIHSLHNTEEGKNIGLSYFKERGFSEKTIEKFRLGYAPESGDSLYNASKDKGYKIDYLEKTGLVKNKSGRHYDGYRGRVIFPIHNLSGRVIAFGGRQLKKSEKSPKYVNTPECDIYHKSKVLYGMHLAKKTIINKNNCYLVEGYTDVVSLHQSGIENVVASSGTSLTEDQIKLIKRFTENITILYDGDSAGIKASFRGIDMILSEGMNVKVVLFPEGEDPDSYSNKVSDSEFLSYIEQEAKDFIVFKTSLLNQETQHDPIKKSEFIHEIIHSIALIPDHISRALYIKECSRIMDIQERALINELNKALRKQLKGSKYNKQTIEHELPTVKINQEEQQQVSATSFEDQEKDIVRLLLNYGKELIEIDSVDENEKIVSETISLAEYIINELFVTEKFELSEKVYQTIVNEYIKVLETNQHPPNEFFINHENKEISEASVHFYTEKYHLNNWEKKHIVVLTEANRLRRAAEEVCYSYKIKRLEQLIRKEEEKVKELQSNSTSNDKLIETLTLLKSLKYLRMQMSLKIGRPV